MFEGAGSEVEKVGSEKLGMGQRARPLVSVDGAWAGKVGSSGLRFVGGAWAGKVGSSGLRF